MIDRQPRPDFCAGTTSMILRFFGALELLRSLIARERSGEKLLFLKLAFPYILSDLSFISRAKARIGFTVLGFGERTVEDVVPTDHIPQHDVPGDSSKLHQSSTRSRVRQYLALPTQRPERDGTLRRLQAEMAQIVRRQAERLAGPESSVLGLGRGEVARGCLLLFGVEGE